MRERKEQNKKGKSLEEMMAYIDENGNLCDAPPDPSKRKSISAEDITLGATKREEDTEIERKGVVSYFNEAKGYGFITDMKTKENVFVHVNQLSQPVKEKDIVTFETEKRAQGLNALKVKKA